MSGIVAVAAISDDIHDFLQQKRDHELIPPRLEERGLRAQSAMAKRGIEWLQQHQSRLSKPSEAGLHRSLDKIASFYHDAYAWQPPPIPVAAITTTGSMRQHVKSWITTWDIERLYGETPNIEPQSIAIDYSESAEIEQAPALVSADSTEE
jgi:hypothetical protein